MSPILVLMLAMALLTSPNTASALSCSDVYNSLSPCVSYFQGGGGGGSKPSNECCNGIKSVVSSARTTADRRAACGCLKSVAAGASGTNVALASGLPAKCGVSIPFKISPTTDCAKVN